MIEKEPITVILSERGWIRAMSGHRDLASADTLKFKEGDGPMIAFHAQTTAKLLLAPETGRIFPLGEAHLTGGSGFGHPVRWLLDVVGTGPNVALMPGDRLAGGSGKSGSGHADTSG